MNGGKALRQGLRFLRTESYRAFSPHPCDVLSPRMLATPRSNKKVMRAIVVPGALSKYLGG
jgi:hypothetical protein